MTRQAEALGYEIIDLAAMLGADEPALLDLLDHVTRWQMAGNMAALRLARSRLKAACRRRH